jgi:hypothetical protein
VGGAARQLALDMNAVIIGNNVPETEGAADVDAWHHLAEVKVPVTVAGGDCIIRGKAGQFNSRPVTVYNYVEVRRREWSSSWLRGFKRFSSTTSTAVRLKALSGSVSMAQNTRLT